MSSLAKTENRTLILSNKDIDINIDQFYDTINEIIEASSTYRKYFGH